MLASKTKISGVTLIELLIGISLVALLLSFAMPSYQQWIQNLQIRTAAESIQNGLQLARTEAIRRNAAVSLTLTSATRVSDWTVGCVAATADCLASIQSRNGGEGSANARIGTDIAGAAFATAITTVAAPAITFNSFGRVSSPVLGGNNFRIDVTNAVLASARRLSVVVSPGGQIRLCDPALSLASNPQGCA